MLDLTDLHDAILDTVTIDVDARTIMLELVPIQFEGAPTRVSLTASGWKAFNCPRQEPWGRAAAWYVNEARGLFGSEAGVQHLELEMQSGDVITVDAENITRVDALATHAV